MNLGSNRKLKLQLTFALLVISAVLLFSAYYYYQHERQQTRLKVHNELNAIGQLKSKQIGQWMKERLSEVRFFSSVFPYPRYIEGLIRGNQEDERLYRGALNRIVTEKRYENIFIVDSVGNILFSLDRTFHSVSNEELTQFSDVFRTGQIEVREFYYCQLHRKIHFEIIAPVFDSDVNIIAAVVFRIDPDDFLYPLVTEWPTPYASGESYLIRSAGDSVVFLNRLRHWNNSDLSLAISFSRSDVTAVRAVMGHEGIYEGNDYRGVSVFSDLRKVPDTGWFLVSEIDSKELFADLNRQAVWLFGVVILVILFFIVAVSWFYHRRQRNFYRELLQKSSELYQAQEEYGTILYSIGDGVITTDKFGFVKHLNPVAERLTGWKEQDATGKSVGEIFRIVHEMTGEAVECPVYHVLQSGTVSSLARNLVLISADGRETPVDDSCAPIRDNNGQVTGAIMVFSDQSEERLRRRLIDFRLNIFEYAISHNLEDTLVKLLDEIGGLFQSPVSFVYFLTHDQESYRFRAYSSRTLQLLAAWGRVELHGETVNADYLKEVVGRMHPLILHHTGNSYGKLWNPREDGMLARELVIPVIRNNKVLAVLGIGNKPSEYSEDDVETLGFLADITWEISEHKLNEQRLQESEEKMRSIFRVAPTGIGVVRNRIIAEVNPHLCVMTGYRADELIGMSSQILYPTIAEYEYVGKEKYDQINLHGSGMVETRWKRKDRRIIDILLSSTPIDPGDHSRGVTFTALDITARKQAELKVKEHERQLASMVSNLPGFVYRCLYDKDWTMLYLSEGCLTITGFLPEDFLMNNRITFNSLIRKEYHEAINAEWQRVLQAKSFFRMEYEIITADREVKWVLERGVGVYDDSGKLLFLEGYMEDVTERKAKEKELLEAKEKAELSDRLKSSFLANMSHEIRTPMNGILGFMELLKEPGLAEDQKADYIDIVNKSGNRLLETINDIIEISKIESGEAKVVTSDFSCEDLMNYHLAFFRPQVAVKNISIEIESQLTGAPAMIRSDKYKLNGILTNLIKNAIKFTEEGYIAFGNYVKGDSLHFYVKDTGKGIAPDRQEAVFDRFVQADLGLSRRHEGSGLGLSICKAHVEALGGNISLESEPGKGSVFYFSIPYFPVSGDIDPVKPTKNKAMGLHLEKTVLIAEDDEPSYQYLRVILANRKFKLIHVRNGLEAVQAVRENPRISLVLMDLKMPELDGLQATKEIRKFNSHVPVIAQTAYVMSDDREIALEAGCQGYLTKPLQQEELFAVLDRYLSSDNAEVLN